MDLKPCPHCGSTDIILHETILTLTISQWRMRCTACKAMGPAFPNHDPKSTGELWNLRAGDDWICVGDMFPTIDEEVLFTRQPGLGVFMGHYHGDDYWVDDAGQGHSEVTLWRPVPQP